MQDIFAVASCLQEVLSNEVAEVQIERQMAINFIPDLDVEMGTLFFDPAHRYRLEAENAAVSTGRRFSIRAKTPPIPYTR